MDRVALGASAHLDRPFDLEDLFDTPDDGCRYEVLDGALVVSPPPSTRHQRVVRELLVLLREAGAAHGLEVLPAPVAWHIGPGQVPEPDLIVVDPSAVGERAVEGTPALVVEVLSAFGRTRDLEEKRRLYSAAGCPRYWIVDPDVPSVLVLRLEGSEYVEEARVTGPEVYRSTEPVAVSLAPAHLVSA